MLQGLSTSFPAGHDIAVNVSTLRCRPAFGYACPQHVGANAGGTAKHETRGRTSNSNPTIASAKTNGRRRSCRRSRWSAIPNHSQPQWLMQGEMMEWTAHTADPCHCMLGNNNVNTDVCNRHCRVAKEMLRCLHVQQHETHQ